LDDAVLSAGGLIFDLAQAGTRVETWTLVCGFPPEGEPSPFAQVLHFQWGFSSAEETVRLRRAEDVRAAGIVGAKPVHFDFPDCIYRRDANGEWLYPAGVFDPPRSEESGLPVAMTEALVARLQPEDVIVCQLAVGHHVDHVTARRAVEALGRPLLYIADIPYLLDHPEELEPCAQGMQFEARPVSSAGLAAWQAGIEAYASQIPMLFETSDLMREKIAAYSQKGVRLWRFA
jgi:LmbE family N-acetylglucosaminyl deacetylase